MRVCAQMPTQCTNPDPVEPGGEGGSGDERFGERREHVDVARQVGVGVQDRDQPLLVETRGQQETAVDPPDPLGVGEHEIGALVVAIVANGRA